MNVHVLFGIGKSQKYRIVKFITKKPLANTSRQWLEEINSECLKKRLHQLTVKIILCDYIY